MPRNVDARATFTSNLGALVGVATVDAADPAGLPGNNVSMLSIDQQGRLRAVLSGSPTLDVIPAFLTSSVANAARVVGPGAGVAVVSVVPGVAGVYDVQVVTYFDTAPVIGTDNNNMQFMVAGILVTRLLDPAVANLVFPMKLFRCTVTAVQAISVNAIVAATATVGYNAVLIATRIG